MQSYWLYIIYQEVGLVQELVASEIVTVFSFCLHLLCWTYCTLYLKYTERFENEKSIKKNYNCCIGHAMFLLIGNSKISALI